MFDRKATDSTCALPQNARALLAARCRRRSCSSGQAKGRQQHLRPKDPQRAVTQKKKVLLFSTTSPKDKIEFIDDVPLNPVWLQGFCDRHMDEEWGDGFPKHLIDVERVVKLNIGGIPLYLDGLSKAK